MHKLVGLWPDIPEEEYFAGPGLSQSTLKEILRSPAHFRHRDLFPLPQTPAMKMGSAVDCYLFEPEDFESRYVVRPPGLDLRTKDGRAWRANLGAREDLTTEDYDRIRGMRDAVWGHPVVSTMMTDGTPQPSFYWEQDGVLCRGRADWLCGAAHAGVVWDLKSTDDARAHRIQRKIADLGYAEQAAWYLDGLAACGADGFGESPIFVFVFVERDPPHGVMVVELESEWIEHGRQRMAEALARYRECKAANTWPAYPVEPIPLEMPKWLK